MYFKSIIFSILMFISGATANAQDHQHTEHLDTLLKSYMNVKDALTEDDFEDAQSHLSKFRSEVVNSNEMTNHEKHSQMHAEHHASMVKAVNNATEADDLESLRVAFKAISNNLVKAVKNQSYDSEELYLQYCPMAGNGEGAHWLSEEEAITNPYMGQKMPSCGKTEEVIE